MHEKSVREVLYFPHAFPCKWVGLFRISIIIGADSFFMLLLVKDL